MKICLITSGQPSANPRLIKEAFSLLNQGYIVSVIWCPISPWADSFDDMLFKNYPTITWLQAGYHYKKQKYLYWYSRIRRKTWEIFYYLLGNSCNSAISSTVLFSQELMAKASESHFDIYIGHNLGALPAIVNASKKFKSKCIFDFEDFHRGESDEGSIQSRMVRDIEAQYLPFVDFITTASPAISSAYKIIFPHKKINTINNYFPLSYAVDHVKKLPSNPLKLFWFSQFVGKQRGLQVAIKAMSFFSLNEITLTLLGNSSKEIKEYFYSYIDELGLNHSQLTFIDPVSENEIAELASLHHIGLASEFVHNQNRDLCLTNKLFMYLFSGNAIVATNTSAQKYFLEDNPGIGSLYEQEDAIALSRVLKNYIENPELLDNHRNNSLQLGKEKCNWNVEQKLFLQNIEQVLAS